MNEREIIKHDALQRTDPTDTIDIPESSLRRDYTGILEYWQMARRHKRIIIVATLAGGVLGFLLTLQAARVYQSRLTLEIQGLNGEFLNMRNVNPTADSSGYSDVDLRTHVRILQSEPLHQRVRQKLEARDAPDDLQPADRIGLWQQALNISPPTEDSLWRQALDTAAGSVAVRPAATSRIVEVACDSTSPRVAADFCNTLAQEYIDENLQSRWAVTEHTGEWLTNQLRDLKIKLEKSEEELQGYVRATGLVYTGEKNDAQETILTDLQKELSAAQADRITKQSKYELAAATPPAALPEALDDESMYGPQSSLAELQGKLAQLQVTLTPNHTEVKRLMAQIASLETSVQQSRANIMTRIRKEYEGAQRREALLTAAYTGQTRAMSAKAEETAHYNLLRREVDASRLLYQNLMEKLKESSIAAAMRANNIRIVDPAEPLSLPYKPDVARTVLLGLLVGMAAGFGFVVLREQTDRTLQDPGDSGYYLGLQELGIIPVGDLLDETGLIGRSKLAPSPKTLITRVTQPPDNRVEMVSWRQKSSLLAESYRTTLTSILFSLRSGERPRVIVFTSASPREGKTTTVSNLAIALAEIGRSVLVIDADMRRPRLHTVFDVQNDLGLSELLLEKTPLDAATLDTGCAETAVPGLYVLPSGASRRSASSLLYSERLGELLALARDRFDTVLVDTPPMVNIADARVVARFADATILVVRSGVTTRDAALLATGRFAEDGLPILGTILNFWNPKKPGYAYYRDYYDGYRHYYGDGSSNVGSNGDDDGSGDGGGVGPPPGPKEDRLGRQPSGARRPQLQFLTSVDDAVLELERQQGSTAPGRS